MRSLIFVFISCVFASAVLQCPKIIVVIDDNLASGEWYEYQRSDNNLIVNGTCTNVIFHNLNECICRRLYSDFKTSQKSIIAEVFPNEGSNDFTYRFPLIDGSEQQYNVIDTDYIDYAILMHCQENPWDEKFIVLTRDPNPQDVIVKKIKRAFKKRRVDPPILVRINNNDCGKF